MFAQFKKPVRVHGHEIPARRFTGWALAYALLFIGLPVTLAMALLDILGWAVTVHVLGADCYGIGCLFG
jgi:hypothetical protein